VITLAVLAALGLGGHQVWVRVISGAGNAHLTSRLREDSVTYKLTFKQAPSGDLRDVRLVLKSDQMKEPGLTFTWEQIAAANPTKARADQDPPIGEELQLHV
jgi:hypothetical protein